MIGFKTAERLLTVCAAAAAALSLYHIDLCGFEALLSSAHRNIIHAVQSLLVWL